MFVNKQLAVITRFYCAPVQKNR